MNIWAIVFAINVTCCLLLIGIGSFGYGLLINFGAACINGYLWRVTKQ